MPSSYAIELANLPARFRGGMARSYADAGDYERAASTVLSDDPSQAQSYAAMGDRTRTRQREDEMREGNRTYAGAIATGDYDTAETVAGKLGSVEGVTGARSARTAATAEERTRLAQGMDQGLAEWAMIGERQGQGYEDYRTRALAAAQQNPAVRPMVANLPAQWSPGLQQAHMRELEGYRDALRTEEERNARGRAQRDLRTSMTPEEVRAAGLRPGTVAQRDGSGQIHVVQQPREPSAGGDGGYRQLSAQEVRDRGLPPGAYQVSGRGQITRIGGGGQTVPQATRDRARGLRELEAAMSNYQGLLANYNPGIPEAGGMGAQTQAIDSAAQILITQLNRVAFELGALAGPDKDIIEGAIGDPTNIQNLWRGGGEGLRTRFNEAMGLVRRKREELERELSSQGLDVESILGDPAGGVDQMSDEELERIANGGQ